MIKLFWYLVSFLTIFLILLQSPSSNSINNFVSQSSIFTFTSNQFLLLKFIIISISIFIILTVLCSRYITL